MEIKRGLAPKVEKGFRVALADLKADRAFLVCSGEERYPKGDGIEAIGLRALAEELSKLDRQGWADSIKTFIITASWERMPGRAVPALRLCVMCSV